MVQMRLLDAARRLNDPRDTAAGRSLGRLLILAETALCTAIVFTVPYTKIDWDAYMQQITLFSQVLTLFKGHVETRTQGERDYTKLVGETGPCVYPAGFVHIFRALQWLTNGGREIFTAQLIFMGIYLLTQIIVMELYIRTERMPPWVLCLLCLSKRVHSVYVLRLFNDGVAMLIAYSAVLCLLQSRLRLAVSLFSLAVSVKMNVLLMAPPVLILLLQGATVGVLCQAVILGIALQAALALPFLLHAPQSYLIQAFDFSRVFLYQWTVNFKFLPEEAFISRSLAVVLLMAHLTLLSIFVWNWCSRDGGLLPTLRRFFDRRTTDMGRLAPNHVLLAVFTGNFVGIVCARSLHYQFYSWYFHSLPFLLWSAGDLSIPMKLFAFGCIELCWNVYPSTPLSSFLLLLTHIVILKSLMTRPPSQKLKPVQD